MAEVAHARQVQEPPRLAAMAPAAASATPAAAAPAAWGCPAPSRWHRARPSPPRRRCSWPLRPPLPRHSTGARGRAPRRGERGCRQGLQPQASNSRRCPLLWLQLRGGGSVICGMAWRSPLLGCSRPLTNVMRYRVCCQKSFVLRHARSVALRLLVLMALHHPCCFSSMMPASRCSQQRCSQFHSRTFPCQLPPGPTRPPPRTR